MHHRERSPEAASNPFGNRLKVKVTNNTNIHSVDKYSSVSKYSVEEVQCEYFEVQCGDAMYSQCDVFSKTE